VLLSCNLAEFYRAFINFNPVPQIVQTCNDKVAPKSIQSLCLSIVTKQSFVLMLQHNYMKYPKVKEVYFCLHSFPTKKTTDLLDWVAPEYLHVLVNEETLLVL